ncbi:hypothetical protein M404DRAFT_1009274 [Pisolithus tinctorius Marx 270]|uniref:Uncharacterized protein n=1 Tax=Pisolithus tinctorius Marx 270 TaxID=870435 RepID=A0A0C3J5K0_PISTI|nr:hypothetical protein M404DRAFT_1009274 [Pisolithus tinctorius Marx 270]
MPPGSIIGAEVSILFTSVSPGVTILQDHDWSLTDLTNYSSNTSRYPWFLIPLLWMVHLPSTLSRGVSKL